MADTQIINTGTHSGTQVITGSTTDTGANFTGGLLQKGETVAGWMVESKMNTASGEADLYIARQVVSTSSTTEVGSTTEDGSSTEGARKGVIKYYRSITKPKTDILDKIKMLNHPDIIELFEYGEYKGRFYEIMEYAAGGSLDTHNSDGSYKYLPLDEEKTIDTVKEIVNAYKTCHEKGIIHRDIKPANIYYRNEGKDIVIGDFGISSIMEESEQLHKTQTGSRTTGYAAPEVLSGIISPAMDYYALGVTIWEMLTGKDPFVMENGKRRNDAHLIRDTIEGRIADDMLSRTPDMSKKMQKLVRGLMVIDSDKRWGGEEVLRFLAGEDVPVYEKPKQAWHFELGEKDCTSLEELGQAILDDPNGTQKKVYRNLLAGFLETDYPDYAKQINEITEEYSAKNDMYNGLIRIAYLLNPSMPMLLGNGFSLTTPDELISCLENAPETVLPLLKDKKSKLYTWLDITGYEKEADEIQILLDAYDRNNETDGSFLAKTEVILRHYIIKPFKLEKYANLELSSLEQIEKLPKELKNHLEAVRKEHSYEGLLLPWLQLLETNPSPEAA
ncbi:MAG: serine/threonine protein kinase [Spirochaetaceae bacterium]|jgi:serine/threonine protein kinase|nr:serine/threonine protein kinase [Spirochaetaceae bacterium]